MTRTHADRSTGLETAVERGKVMRAHLRRSCKGRTLLRRFQQRIDRGGSPSMTIGGETLSYQGPMWVYGGDIQGCVSARLQRRDPGGKRWERWICRGYARS